MPSASCLTLAAFVVPNEHRSVADDNAPGHRGVAEQDPRNRLPISFFAPKEITFESAREQLMRTLPRASPAKIEKHARQVMARIAAGPTKPSPPLSQSLAEIADPWFGLGTHPDIVSHLWKLDESLPQRCRWVFWGRPALVHPETGVVFAVGFGTIGYVMRLPPAILKEAANECAKIIVTGNPGQTFDIGPVGTEWRFVTPAAPERDWCRAAYEFARAPAP
jgi:hypothetical protein